ncbi:hypothetical protein T4B_2919 [Trichinella pseudospiralis]|uniref:Uncharacterized protein n=1 Tax=Trichinella pseudospiralis TaxID=6337 RepID=A0A0V1EAX8_TRIPS|nr:hypothetical protein T4A_4404 [Trichinella pseudospiralis]KRZ21602.1 hypothetical protein T4B_2919 [Trichinella pseudospiralis]
MSIFKDVYEHQSCYCLMLFRKVQKLQDMHSVLTISLQVNGTTMPSLQGSLCSGESNLSVQKC